MEATTTGSAIGTGSSTIADLLPLAAERYAERPALRHKLGDAWVDVSYADLGTAAREVALGLVDLGLRPGDKVAILSHTRPEWTQACFGILTAGGVLVTIYQTNSAEECQYVLAHSDARMVFAEDAEQLAKVRSINADCPALEQVIVFDPADAVLADEISLAALRDRGAERDPGEWAARYAAVQPDDMCLYIYTSGTTGPPKGCLLSHRNYRTITESSMRESVLDEGDSCYLFLPLAHAFAVLIQLVVIDLGVTLAYWTRDPQKIVPELMEVNPTYFPSVPRMFEKIYTLATTNAPDREKLLQAVELGVAVRQLQDAGKPVPDELREPFALAEESLFKNVRGLFGQRIRECVTGAAPIAEEILRFFYACGVPVMEGYGMTETATVATVNRARPGEFRFGSVGKPLPGVQVRIAPDGEILIKGPNIFQGYYKDKAATHETLEADGWLHTGDLGHLDEDGFLFVTGRKKDIIITAGGKNITPANLENGLKQSRWISQAVVVGDRRPCLVALLTLDPDEVPALGAELGIDDPTPERLAADPRVHGELQEVVDEVNSHVGPVEQIKRFAVLPHDLSQETGELTPTLKVKRTVVHEKYANVVDELYA